LLKVCTTGFTVSQADCGPDTSAVTSPRCAEAALPEIGMRR
jgi:hypothetical protein